MERIRDQIPSLASHQHYLREMVLADARVASCSLVSPAMLSNPFAEK